ncbi:S1 RNA-binding domain-containing protein [Lewinella sp. LCG006]|uniref:CvfB family protein n=1 Tax=Lewinella sp. LCG006 TaxID=3231911 RepID=UPI0034612F60
MIAIGKYNDLEILRETSVGLFLGDEEGEDVLLPNKYVPEHYDIGDQIRVFVYLDYDERKVATTLTPGILLNEFALLEVVDVADVGTFLDWGMEKHLMVPYSEQRVKMEEGRWYVVYLALDEETDRLYASNKLEKWLVNDELTVEEGEEVEILVYRETEIGYSVTVNNKHRGLVYKNEIFKDLRIGDKMTAYVKKIREGNKIDISLHPIGYQNFNSKNSEDIYHALEQNNGYLPITDKSDPEVIYHHFQISKKAFKKAIGDLYRQRKITLEDGGIRIAE